MDARRNRRTKSRARKAWYAFYRQVRFARWLGFASVSPATGSTCGTSTATGKSASHQARSPMSDLINGCAFDNQQLIEYSAMPSYDVVPRVTAAAMSSFTK